MQEKMVTRRAVLGVSKLSRFTFDHEFSSF